jgi:long-subunit fatty acid transport protein
VKTSFASRTESPFVWLSRCVQIDSTRAAAALLGCAISCLSSAAHAAGIEDTVTGGYTLGRAAGVGSVHDFMAVWQNPANLAVIPGANLGSELRVPIFQACYDRAADPDAMYKVPTEDFKGDEHVGNVCNSGPIIPTGAFGFAQSFDNGVGWGLGFYAPAGIGALNYGHSTNVTVFPLDDEQLPITETGVEWPTRQMLIRRRQVGGWLTAGVGLEPIRQLRLGASFGYGFAYINNTNMASAQGGSFRDQEVINQASVIDWFVPRAIVSAVLAPVDSFEIFGALTYQADVNAKGHLDLKANGIRGAPRKSCLDESPGPHCRVDNVTLDAPFPTLEATFGFRYAERRHKRQRVLDPMKDEKWDISVEGTWAQTSHVDEFKLTIFNESDKVKPKIGFSSDLENSQPVSTPQSGVIKHNWKDTFGLRVGGDINLIPESVSMRLGLSYSSNAVRPGYMNIDAFPVQKIGLHAGISLQKGNQKVTLAYAHIFYKDTTVPVGSGKVQEIVSTTPEAANAVNEGFYQASQDVISLHSNLAF